MHNSLHRHSSSQEPMDEAIRVLQEDPVMARLIEKHDIELDTGERDEFERICVSIINQQLSSASAAAVRERVFSVLDDEVTPESVLSTKEEPLRDAGLSRTKVAYIENVAREFSESDLTRRGLSDHSDEEVIDRLTEIKGVGEWTARMYLMFALGRQDVLPLGDLAVRRGFEQVYRDGVEMSRDEMRDIAEVWRPWRTVGTRYIWAEYESGK